MFEYTDTNVLHHLNKPPRILVWSLGEFVTFISIFALGVIYIDYIDWALGAIVIFGVCSKRFKQKFGETGGLAQLIFWQLPKWKAPKSNIKEYIS